MQDYLIFGHGYDGDMREDDPNLNTLRVVSKPVMGRANDMPPGGGELKWYYLQVARYDSRSGNVYNIASDEFPGVEAVERAIMENNPRPV